MDVTQALNSLSEIREKLSQSQIYRGYRPLTVALTGVFAIFGGWLSQQSPPAIVWPAVAIVCLALVGGEMAYDYLCNFSRHQQHMARKVLHQFLPGLMLGAGWTVVWLQGGHSQTFLPAVWSLCYSHCLFASRPYLPVGVGYVALFYGLCAMALSTPLAMTRFNLGMTLTFALGQGLLALILYCNHPRGEC